MSTIVRDPVRIYVLWHPECVEGQSLANSIFNWFRGNPENLSEAGYGIPVYFRSVPWKPTRWTTQRRAVDGANRVPTPDDPLPRPIALNRSSINVIVPLVDEHMVIDSGWRGYLRELASVREEGFFTFLVPVALHSAAYHLPEEITRLNFLRLERAADPASWTWKERSQIRRSRLLSLLTQVLGRLLTGGPQRTLGKQWRDVPTPPIKVFISHAKADGVPVAEAIRQHILDRGQLQVFFDESDLAIGYEYQQELERGAQAASEEGEAATMAMISVYTDAYASRPWCQRELRLARRPAPLPVKDGNVICWRSKPLVIVDALEKGNTRFLPDAGYATVVTWDPQRLESIIDNLMRELMLYAYNEKRAALLPQREDGGRHALNCAPDLAAVLTIVREAEIPKESVSPLRELAVPPPGPATVDRQALEQLAGGVLIRSYDEVLTSGQ